MNIWTVDNECGSFTFRKVILHGYLPAIFRAVKKGSFRTAGSNRQKFLLVPKVRRTHFEAPGHTLRKGGHCASR